MSITEVVHVRRDTKQSLNANRGQLNTDKELKILKHWDELVLDSKTHPEQQVVFKGDEEGGAHPQVSAVYDNVDFMEVYRDMRAHAPNTVMRPLFRGANGFLLEPSHKDDLAHLLRNLAEDQADFRTAPEGCEELLRIKLFDSQGIIEEMASCVDTIKQLRDEGYLITPEIAIPYTQGEVYPDEVYLDKVESAFLLLLRSGIPMHLCRISLKDMIGQLDQETVRRLLPKMIKKLKELQKAHETEQLPIGLHLHNTGLATDAYVAAKEVCDAEDYPLTIDTVESELYDPSYVDENEWRNTGFASLLNIAKAYEKGGKSFGLTEFQIKKLKEIAKLGNEIAHEIEVTRAEPVFSGEELRDFAIPGGAFASFSRNVAAFEHDKKKGLANILDLTEREAMLIVGYALKVSAELMGEPHAVTPGYQNKEITARNYIKNLLEEERIKVGMSFEQIKQTIEKDLSDKEVEDLILKNLSVEVREFLKGEMPAETLQRLGIKSKASVHPVIRKALPRRTGLLTDNASKLLDKAREEVEVLYNEGKLHPTKTQIDAVNKAYPAATDVQKQDILKYKVIQTHITWSLELGPGKLRNAIEKPWLREPDPEKYQGDKAGYLWALDKFRRGRNPAPDHMEQRYEQFKQGAFSLDHFEAYVTHQLSLERNLIHKNILDFAKANNELVTAALSGSLVDFNECLEQIYHGEERIISEKENKGEYFLFPRSRRLDIALDYFCTLAKENAKDSNLDFSKLANEFRKMQETIHVKAPMPGTVTELHVKTGQVVKKGDTLAVFNAMKMDMSLKAPKAGVIEEIRIAQGETVDAHAVMMVYKEEALQQVNDSKPQAKKRSLSLDEDLNIRKQTITKENEITALLIENYEKVMDNHAQRIQRAKKDAPSSAGLMQDLQRQGYFGKPLKFNKAVTASHQDEVHVIGNRSVCAAELYAILKQMGVATILLHTRADENSPLIKHAPANEKRRIDSYKGHHVVIEELKAIAQANPGKTIYYHPGWGFLAEDADFVAKLEALEAEYKVKFVGPPSEPMRLAGDKTQFRKFVAEVAPEINIPFFGNEIFTAAELKSYIEGGFKASNPIDQAYRAHFESVVNDMGGHVKIKAVAGGGGMGIKEFEYDADKDKESNYREYVSTVHKNVEFSEDNFKNGEMLTEQCITGETRHLEVQFACNEVGELILFVRDCTAQKNGQKVNETKVIKGDYKNPNTISVALNAAKKMAERLREQGYRGLGTFEFLVSPEGEPRILETNTRLQVEHFVTELLFECGIPLAFVNYLFSKHSDQTPEAILAHYFGISPREIRAVNKLGVQRYEHLRVNSRLDDLLTGESVPAFFWGYMWPGREVLANVADKSGAQMIIEDIGDGNYVAQTGAVWGTSKQVQAAARGIQRIENLARICLRSEGALNVEAALEMHKLMYNEEGNFNPNFSTKTWDDFFAAIERGDVKLDPVDYQHLGITPKPGDKAVGVAFDDFLTQEKKKRPHKTGGGDPAPAKMRKTNGNGTVTHMWNGMNGAGSKRPLHNPLQQEGPPRKKR